MARTPQGLRKGKKRKVLTARQAEQAAKRKNARTLLAKALQEFHTSKRVTPLDHIADLVGMNISSIRRLAAEMGFTQEYGRRVVIARAAMRGGDKFNAARLLAEGVPLKRSVADATGLSAKKPKAEPVADLSELLKQHVIGWNKLQRPEKIQLNVAVDAAIGARMKLSTKYSKSAFTVFCTNLNSFRKDAPELYVEMRKDAIALAKKRNWPVDPSKVLK